MSNHIQPNSKTLDKYNDLMAQIKQGKADAGMSYSQLGKEIDRSRLGALTLMVSENISLKNFITLANAVGLSITLNKQQQ